MRLKRVLAVICTLALLATMIIPVSASEPMATISAGEFVVKHGTGTETVVVPIKIDKTISVNTLQVNVSYDTALTYAGYEAGDAVAGIPTPGAGNPVRIVFGAMSNTEIKAGTLATLKFEVSKATLGEYPITINVAEVYNDSSMDNLASSVSAKSGKISVEVEPIATISADKTTAVQGTGTSTVSVPIKIDKTISVNTLQVNVGYDTALTYAGYEAGDAVAGIPTPGAGNPVKIVFGAMSNTEIKAGTLATLKFEVPLADLDKYAITVEVAEVYDDSSMENKAAYIKGVDGEIEVIDEVVDQTATWSGVSVAPINYGANIETAFTLPTSGTIKIDGVDYNGTYSVKEAGATPDAGTAKATVVFTINETEATNGGRKFEKEYDVTVNQVSHDVAGIKLNATEYIYTGSPVVLDIYDSENVTAKSYATKTGDALAAAPSEVGEYKVTLEKAATTNNAATTNDVDFKIVAAAATISTTAESVSKSWTAYEAKGYTTVAAIKEAMNLPEKVDVAYGESTGTAEITWADATESYNAKEATYTFVGTPSDANLTFNGATLIATAKVTKSEVGFSTPLAPVTIKKSVLEKATEAEVGLASELTITGENINEAFEPTWSKTLDELKELDVADTETVEITNVPAWATFGDGATKYTVTVTDKDPVNVLVTQTGATYGTEIAAYGITLENAGYGVPEIYGQSVKYTGTTAADVAYDSVDAPKEAGSYTVTVTVANDTYEGVGSAEFTIAPLEIAYTVSDVEKKYSLANPVFGGTLGSALGYDDVEADLGLEFKCADTKEFAAGQTAEISVTMANKNYTFGESGLTKGTLTVIKMPLYEVEGLTVAISGEAAVGEVLEAVVSDAVAQTEYTYQWIYPTEKEMIEGATGKYYEPTIADSNKDIAVYILAKEDGNYEDTSLDSETVTVAKYAIKGVLAATAKLGEDGILNAGDTVEVDYTGVEEIEALKDADAEFDVVWTVGEGTVTGETLTITEEMTGAVSVTVTAIGNYEGSLSANVGEIGKSPISGTITLTKDGDVVTAEVNISESATYELKWYVGEDEIEVEGLSYTTTKDDLGKSIVVKAIGTEDYAGEVVSNEIVIPAEVPSELEVTVDSMLTNATITMSAFDGGSEITEFVVTIGEDEYTVEANEDGEYVLEVTDLEIGVTYEITVVAVNEVGDSEAWTGEVTPIGSSSSGSSSKPSSSGSNSGSGSTSNGTTETTETEVSVTTKEEKVTIPAKDLEGKESVSVDFEVSDDVTVNVTTDIKDAGASSVVATVEPVKAEVSGEVAEGMVGEPISVSVTVLDEEKAEVEAKTTVSVSSEEKAYAYTVDANGNTVRIESSYDSEAAAVVVEGVENGTVLVISTKAPVIFSDVEGRWSDAEVHKAADLGLVNGKGEGFDPSGKLTRHENNKLQMNLAKALKVEFEKDETVKIDTHEDHWGFDSDLWAAQTGVTNGVGTTEDGAVIIDGSANITRQDYMTAIARLFVAVVGDVEVEGEAVEFADAAEIADYAKEAVELLSKCGIVNGSEANGGLVVAPTASITREEAAAILNRVYDAITALK